MSLVYSYVRFSSKKQEQGDSLRRQTEQADAWIARNGHTLADSYIDPGVSAFRGKHRHKKALSRFLQLVENGTIKKGSILVIEALDRLSREGVYDAYGLFLQIINAGIKIAVLSPEERVYDRRKQDDFISLLMPIISFYLAHIESKKKSDHVSKFWQNARAKAHEKKPSTRRPSWLDWDEGLQDFTVKPGAGKAIKYIFEATIDGAGQRKVLDHLTKHHKPIGRSGSWNSSFIQKVLNDRAVLGEWQPHTFTEDGERVPVGEPITDYYPRIIDDKTFYRAQQEKAGRYRQKRASEDFVNLFVGLVVFPDGAKGHIQTSRAPGKKGTTYRQRRLVSYNHNRKLKGACPISIDYYSFEKFMLHMLHEIKPDELLPTVLSPTQEELEGKQAQLDALRRRAGELEALLEDPESKLDAVVRTLKSVEAKQRAIEEDIEVLKTQANGTNPAQYLSLIDALEQAKDEEEEQAIRLKMRAIIPRLVDRIEVEPQKRKNRRVVVKAKVYYASGLAKEVEFDRNNVLSMTDNPPYSRPHHKS